MQDYVDAVFDGTRQRMGIPRSVLGNLDAEIGGSAFAALRRFVEGQWSRRDVEITLEYATLTPGEVKWILNMQGAIAGHRPPRVGRSAVAILLDEKPIAPYAELAALIIEAALYGIAPAVAVFDEGAGDGKEAA
ncbi:hypothetical protein KHC23_12330 [Ancylobacter dichloromethanicus]|uniref:Uncharacterized protein n=1 Tax=Ancylobacter dichloromethanicus TaxID=518825 RepID=A0A9W6J940_9HYPH|nr:hypothetical protein [Ancylobacter dichloromethanicus]MBS7554441.1 hypothetical protein [Ancylobacter dichloromethanicus]GLK71569.1 hypothetical protein GCM10017643_16840 [Ancylobacter dichloromethanicus]